MLDKILTGIFCGAMAIVFAPAVALFLSGGVIIAGYTKTSVSISFIWGYVCGYAQKVHGNVDRDRIRGNLEVNQNRLDRLERMRRLARR
jgi:hypothetical protein